MTEISFLGELSH